MAVCTWTILTQIENIKADITNLKLGGPKLHSVDSLGWQVYLKASHLEPSSTCIYCASYSWRFDHLEHIDDDVSKFRKLLVTVNRRSKPLL